MKTFARSEAASFVAATFYCRDRDPGRRRGKKEANVRCRPIADVRCGPHTAHMQVQFLLSALAILPLAGCSYVYDLKAAVIDGHIAFLVDPQSRSSASCIRSIEVTSVSGERAIAANGDNRQSVARGVFWKQATASDQCLNPFPVFYGAKIQGKPFEYQGTVMGSVAAKPLVVNAVYEVTASGSGSGYGSRRFRILTGGGIENLPRLGQKNGS